MPEAKSPLLVFADDWGRHPSSCQHLIQCMLGHRQVVWVNTIGMRPPRWNASTLKRGLEKTRQWLQPAPSDVAWGNPVVINPRMWPWFSTALDRSINRQLLVRQLKPWIQKLSEPPVAITTVPIVADLIGGLPVARWWYYCVDDFSAWPGHDREAIRRLERRLVRRVDRVIVASETLREAVAEHGRDARLLTHGVDLNLWRNPALADRRFDELPRPLIVFWGVVDRRMDTEFLRALVSNLSEGLIILAGPISDPDPELFRLPRVVIPGPVGFDELPALAQAASVLIMPYVDARVTRAMQPLKLKEYLATGKPVIVRDLPANREWADALDLATTPSQFQSAVCLRLNEGVPSGQLLARKRLATESWNAKAALFERWLERDELPWEQGQPIRKLYSTADAGAGVRYGSRGKSVILEARVVAGSGGGPDKTIFRSPQFLDPHGYRTICAYMHPPDDPGFDHLTRKAAAAGADLVSIPDRGPWDWRVVKAYRQLCEREGITIWHGHDYKTNLLGLLVRRRYPMRLVTTLHGWVHHTVRTPIYYKIDSMCLPHYEAVLCVSEDLYSKALRAGVPADRCYLVENGIDVQDFQRSRDAASAKISFGIPPTRLTVGAVGRLSEEKGFDILIRAVSHLLQEGIDLELLIAGEGPLRPTIERWIEALELGHRVRLLGHLDDPKPLYEALDVFALSSRREGLPNVLLEAMAMEVPVVATRVNGVPRLIDDRIQGLLVDPESAEQLSIALAELLSNPSLRARLGTAGRKTVRERYDFAARMTRVRQIYDDLLARA